MDQQIEISAVLQVILRRYGSTPASGDGNLTTGTWRHFDYSGNGKNISHIILSLLFSRRVSAEKSSRMLKTLVISNRTHETLSIERP
jgi:hypothetical protein